MVAEPAVDGAHRGADRDADQDRQHHRDIGGQRAQVEAEAPIVEAAQGGAPQDDGREGADPEQPSRLALGVMAEAPQPAQAAEGDLADLVVVLRDPNASAGVPRFDENDETSGFDAAVTAARATGGRRRRGWSRLGSWRPRAPRAE
jgi:hypothetical protein